MNARPPLSVSLAGLASDADAPWSGSPRRAIEWAAGAGFGAVRLDASSLRARDLDRSARRDLASLLRRLSLKCVGVDLWIPPAHFADHARAERAVDALKGAAVLAADLRSLGAGPTATVATAFPAAGADDAMTSASETAHAAGIMIADHAFPLSARTVLMADDPVSSVGVGVDPAAVLMAGGDPAAHTASVGRRLAGGRWSDASAVGRVRPGDGRLDGLSFIVAMQTAGYCGDIALDLRGLPDQDRTARRVLNDWALPLSSDHG